MKRFLILLAALLLTGCAAAPASEPFFCFTDSTGAQVSLPAMPRKTAVLFSSHAEVWRLAGGTVDITVGESVERGFASENAVLVDGGAGKTIDTEKLLASKPDLVIGSSDIPAQVEACTIAARAGIPAALFRVDTFADYLQMLRICTQITGNSEAYEACGTAVRSQIEAVLKAVEGLPSKNILFIRAGSTDSATKAKRAPENFVCSMLQELNTYNIADDAPVLLDGLSLEHILVRDPDFIFISTMGNEEAAVAHMTQLLSQPGWRELTAVKNGNYAFLPRALFHFKPNARWAEAYWHLAGLLNPELEERYVEQPQ